ncbi:GntR family transcriptional regulator [Streptomyces sp. XD-27]|uniref:GntR family transcriptional regulator n=1 Tax=Streptomyces sp. XD-27 TaxID=3062779 RepID=UPI0026F41325|nr:GntR family transcriptional regulator [Streptomyces sp. XD-27]WKX70785.1 GntR family transcriptional regulator [Streptomyces sp. XD-27]
MAIAQPSAPSAPCGGVVHVRHRHTENFTILANRLAQRSGSAVTVGVAAYILSLPDGASITAKALCAHFTEGDIVIRRALRELEAEGWLERRVERGERGTLVTRTFVYDQPGSGTRARAAVRAAVAAVPPPRREPESRSVPRPVPQWGAESAPQPRPAPEPVAAPSPQAVGVLAALRRRDARLALSGRDIARLAPAVDAWFARGAWPGEIVEALTTALPDRLTARPAGLIGHRLRELLPPQPVPDVGPRSKPSAPPVVPLQNCDGCDRAFRAAAPGRCRDCRGG